MRLRAALVVAALAVLACGAAPSLAASQPSHDVSDPGFDASLSQLTGNAAGAAVALWSEHHGDDSLIDAASMDAGDRSLGQGARLSAVGGSAFDARAAIAPNGDALVVWDRSDGAHQIVQAVSRAAGQAWGTPQNISAAGADAYHPQVALGTTGDAVAVWSRSNGATNVIQAASLPVGGSWGAAVDLSTPANVTRTPQVAIGGDGTAVAAWQRSSGDYSTIQVSVLTRGAWSVPLRLSVPGENAGTPRVAMDDAGDAVVLWRWFDGASWLLESAFRPTGGSWQRVEQVSVAGFSVASPQLAMNGAGQAVAIWAYGSEVWTSQLGAGGRWSSEREVDAGDARDASRSSAPSVAIDASGNETAVWAPNGYVYGSFKAHDADAWDKDQVVDCNGGNDDTCFYPYQPHVVLGASGSAVALFMESRTDHEVLTSAAFDNTQPPADSDNGDDSGDGSGDDSSSDDSGSDAVAITSDPGTGTILDHTAALLPGKRIRVTVRCGNARSCRGQLVLRSRTAHVALAGLPVQVAPGRARTVVMRLTGLPGAVLWKGARLRVQVSVQRVRRGRLVLRGHALVIVGRHQSPARA
jgi:hypothetical protein